MWFSRLVRKEVQVALPLNRRHNPLLFKLFRHQSTIKKPLGGRAVPFRSITGIEKIQKLDYER